MRRPLAPLPVLLPVLLSALLVGCTSSDADTGADSGSPPEEEPIEAGTETVSTSWDVDLFSMYESPSIPRFDTLDGRRQLDGMTIAVDHTAVMTVSVENGSDFALTSDDYMHEFYLQSIIQLGRVDEEDDGSDDGPPFFGPGAFIAVQAVDLAAADGTEESGEDYLVETLTDSVQFEALYDWAETPTYLEALIGTEPLPLVVGGFSESWVYWSDEFADGGALLYAGASAIQYSGTMTVTYTYSPAEE